jgi:transposase
MEERPMSPHRRPHRTKPSIGPSLLDRINPNAAGIDCGADSHYVAVAPDRDPMPVRAFQAFTTDLHRVADWLTACGVTTVAMESTGVYWIPLYEILEARGLEVVLVNARHVKNVPGRKTDVVDCQWLQELHSVGLLRGSFRPTAAIAALRAYLRHRETLVQSATTHIQRMQKALVQMNLQLPIVISDITGVTGLRILHAIVAGQTDPHLLAQYRDPRCRASKAEITAALTGHYRPEHVFVLQQNLALFEVYQEQLAACDVAIEAHVRTLAAEAPAPGGPLPPARTRKKPRNNEPRFEIRTPLHHLTGVDLTQIDAIGPYSALRLLAEIGADMTRWPTEKHFTSWLTLAPQNKISGGRLLSSKTQPSANRAATILRMAAMNLGRTDTALGAFYRRLAYRVGKAKAITATARKLAILVYRTLKHGLLYQDPGATAYDAQHRLRVLRRLRHRAASLGFSLLNRETGELLDVPVS